MPVSRGEREALSTVRERAGEGIASLQESVQELAQGLEEQIVGEDKERDASDSSEDFFNTETRD